jgi:membrane protease YdiL (CAAX protease family)
MSEEMSPVSQDPETERERRHAEAIPQEQANHHEDNPSPDCGPIRGPVRLPGPAEAGLLFSLTAVLQLYAVQWLNRLTDSQTLQVILAEFLFIALPPLLFAWIFRYSLRETFRLRRPRARDAAFLLLLAPVATLTAYSAGILAIVLVRMAFGTLQLAGDMGDILSRGLPSAVLTIGLVPALCEEWLFRGFFQRGLEGYGARKAVLISGLLFGLFHFDFQRFAAQALLGLVIAYVVYRTGSILNGMLLHFLHNAGSVLISGAAGGIDPLAATANGDIFEMPAIVEYARQMGLSMDQLIRGMAAGSAIVLICGLLVLGGLLIAFRHLTRDIVRPVVPKSPKHAFLTSLPGLLLILAMYAALALHLAGHPAAKTILRVLRLPVV